MKSRYLIGPLVKEARADTIEQAGTELRDALANCPDVTTIRLWLDPDAPELRLWLETVTATTPEMRGMMVQAFFARMCIEADYDVTVGKELDIYARDPFRTLLIEVKSSLAGGKFGSQVVLNQLEGYTRVRERRGAKIWLGIMGIKRPIFLGDNFRAEIQSRNIGLIEVRWISPRDTLLPHLRSVT